MDSSIPLIRNLRPVTVTATKLSKSNSTTTSSPLRPFPAKNYDIKFRASPQILSMKEYSSVNASPFKESILSTSNYRSNSPRQFEITSPKGHKLRSPRDSVIESPLSSRLLRVSPEREIMQRTSSVVSLSGGEKQSQNVKEKQKGHLRSNSNGMTPNMYPKVFSTKVLPMFDARGKLNVKFFLKPNMLKSPSNSLYQHQHPFENMTQTVRSPQNNGNNGNRNFKGQYASQNSTPQTNPFMLTNSRPSTILSRRDGPPIPIQTKSLPKGIGTLVIPQRTNETGSSRNEIIQSQDEIMEEKEKSQHSNKIDWEELFLQFEEKVTNQLIGSSGRSGYTTSKAGNQFMVSDTRRSSGVLGADNEWNEPLYLHEAIKISTMQQKERDSSIKKKGRLWVPKELRKGANSSGEVKDYLREKRLAREEKILNIDVIDKIQPVRTRISPKQLLLEQQLRQEDAVNISEEGTVEIEGLLPKLEETYNEKRQEKTPNSVAKKRQQAIGGWTSTSFSQTYTEMDGDHRGTPINNQKKLSSYSKAIVESKALRSNNKLQRPTVLLEEKSGAVEGSLGHIKGSSKDLSSLTKMKTETKIKIKTKSHVQLKPLTKKERDAEMAYMKKVNSYKLFMSRINFSFNILIKQEQPVTVCYKFYAESPLIVNIMKQRWWWAPAKDKSVAGINFMWTQGVNTKYIGTLQKQRKPGEEVYETEINGISCIEWESNLASMNTVVKAAVDSEQNLLFESQATSNRNSPLLQSAFDEIKLKQPSLRTLSISALDEKDNKKGSSKMKKQKTATSPMLSAKTELEDVELLKNLLTKRELGLMRNYYSTKVKTKKEMNHQDFEEMSKMRSRQTLKYVSDVGKQKICNHMENNNCLSDQAQFFETMRNYYEGKTEGSKNLLRTFYVKGGLEDKEFKSFVECFNQKQKNFGALVMAKGTRNIAKENTNYWVVKPVGIKLKGNSNPIYNDLTSIIRVIHDGKRVEAELGNGEIVYMIQQYIDRPMLYQKKRMEIKCFILISTLNNHMKGYWYQDGYVNVVDAEKPNHMTFDDFRRFLEDDKAYEGMFKTHIYPQFKTICEDIIKSICGKIDPHRRESTFEISEVTLMVDKDLKVWLLEVNPQPEFKDDTKILADFIPTMIDNVLRVTIDPIFPVINWNDVNKANLPEKMLEANKLELVYDEMEEAFLAKNSMKGKDYTIDEVGKIVALTNEDLP